MKELETLWETVEFFSRHRDMNWSDYEIYKNRLRNLITDDDKFQAAMKKLAEVMGL